MQNLYLFLRATILLISCSVPLATAARAQTLTWTAGANSSDWNDPNNWSPPGPPSASTAVIIPSASFNPSIGAVPAPTCGGLTVMPGGALDFGAAALTVHGTADVAGALLGTGAVRLAGTTGTPGLKGDFAPGIDVELLPGTVMYGVLGSGGARVRGDLRQLAGAGVLSVAGNSMTVDGLLDLRGNGFTGGDPVIVGSINLATQSPVTSPGNLVCRGAWTSNDKFQPASGRVTFTGPASRTVQTDPFIVWYDLWVDPGTSVTLTTGATLRAQDLLVAGNLTSPATQITIERVLEVQGTGSLTASQATSIRVLAAPRSRMAVGGAWTTPLAVLDLDTGLDHVAGTMTLRGGAGVVHDIRGSLAVSGNLQVAAGAIFRLGATSVPASISGSFPLGVDIEIAPSTATHGVAGHIRGNLRQSVGAGNLACSTLTVAGQFDLRGNSFSGNDSVTAGSINLATQNPVTMPGSLVCQGNWTSNDKFQPASGRVTFTGPASRTVQTDPFIVWYDLWVDPGTSVTLTTGATLRAQDLLVAGNLTSPATQITIERVLEVQGTGSLTASQATSIRVLAAPRSRMAVGGTWTTPLAVLDLDTGLEHVAGTMTLRGGAGVVHDIRGSLAVSGNLQVAAGAIFRLGATSAPASISGSFPAGVDIELAPGTTTLGVTGPGTRIRGSFRQAVGAGNLVIGGNTLAVDGLLDLRGNGFTGGDPLTVGSINVATRDPVVTIGNIDCRGDWTSNNQLQPNGSGRVTFNGNTPQNMTVSPGTCIPSLTINSGATLVVHNNLCITGSTTIAGTLVVGPSGPVLVEARGNCSVNNGAVSLQADDELGLGSNFTNNGGTYSNAGTLRMTGTGSVTSNVAIGRNLTVDSATGTIAIVGLVAVGGDLTINRGLLSIGAGNELRVAGTARFLGGNFATSQGTLDLNGDAFFIGTGSAITNPPPIRCAGNWVADAQFFAPTAGKVELDGPGTSVIDGISGAPPRVRFFDLDLANGIREPAGNLAISIGGTAVIRDGARLRTGTREIVGEPMRGVIRDGQLVINAGGRLTLDPTSTIDVAASGVLRLDGAAAAPAWILDNGTPGWQLRVAGGIDALHFGLQGMGPAGVQILAGAQLGLAPYDFRLGTLRRGSPGGVLLDINLKPGDPVRALRYLTFENSPATALHNLRARNTTRPPNTRIRVVNSAGAFAGANFEDDPNDVVTWSSAQTTLRSPFRAAPRLGRIDLSFATQGENDDGVFHITFANAPNGPFTDIPGSPFAPLGGGAGYAYLQRHGDNLQPLAKYYYKLEQVLPHGERILLGTSFARPLPQAVGMTAFVGPGGFSDIPSAITAAGPGGNVVVAPGSYPAFSIAQSVHVMSDGSGMVTIDTTAGPLTISGIPQHAGDVALYDLAIGPGASAGIQVSNCLVPVVVDHCSVATSQSTNVAAIHIDGSPQVAIQTCTLSGGPGLRVSNGSVAYVSAGNLDTLVAEVSALVKYAGLSGFGITIDATSSVQRLDNTMPALAFASMASSEQTVLFEVSGDPSGFFAVQAAAAKFYFDLTVLQMPIDMVLLLGLDPNVSLGVGALDSGGLGALPIAIPPTPELWGLSLPLQALVIAPTIVAGRWTNVRDLLIVP